MITLYRYRQTHQQCFVKLRLDRDDQRYGGEVLARGGGNYHSKYPCTSCAVTNSDTCIKALMFRAALTANDSMK